MLMGRGNVCTHNECEGLYFLDKDLLDVYRRVELCDCGQIKGFDWEEKPKTARELIDEGMSYDYDGKETGWGYDEHGSRDNWRNMVEHMTKKLEKRFPSFQRINTLRARDLNVVLRNGLFEIAIVDNEWSAAWCLLERADVDDSGSNRALMRHHYEKYLEAIKGFLIEGWGEAFGYGGTWARGKKYTKDDIA